MRDRILHLLDTTTTAVTRLVDTALEAAVTPALDRLYDRNEALAMTDPEYAAIEARRRSNGPHTVLFSDELNLGLDEALRQIDIREARAEHPWWEKPARLLRDRPTTRAHRVVKHAAQRVTRSWDDTATWSLDTHLARTLGAQLHHLADTTHGWPQSEEFPEFDDWAAALRANADALLAYGNRWDDDADATGSPEEIRAREAARYAAAQDALRWVADHLDALWD